MSSQLPITIGMGALPPTGRWTPQQLADLIAARLYLQTAQSFSLFVAGSTEPSSNVGPWLKNNNEWYVWSDATGDYVPITIDSASLGYYVGSDTPDHTVYSFWIETTVGGAPVALKIYYSGAWTNVYTLGTIASQDASAVAITGGSAVFTTSFAAKGTTTNDSAAVGYIGQYTSSTVTVAAGVNLPSATPTNLTSIALTAGDWDVSGIIYFDALGATNITGNLLIWASISQTSATLGGFDNGGDGAVISTGGNGYDYVVPTPTKRISLSGSATIYLVAQATHNAATGVTIGGTLRARRVR